MKGENRILESTFHHNDFKDKAVLVRQKEAQKLKISLAFPTLNEEATIGKEVLVLKTELMDRFPLLDEIAVIDSGSKDRTREAAAENGARVFSSADILRKYGTYRGKGENLWKSLYVLAGDIIVWIDADISNIAPKFVYGLVGPLLRDPRIGYVKAFYERPFRAAGELIHPRRGREGDGDTCSPAFLPFLSRAGVPRAAVERRIRGTEEPSGTAPLLRGLWSRAGAPHRYLSPGGHRGFCAGQHGSPDPSQPAPAIPREDVIRNPADIPGQACPVR